MSKIRISKKLKLTKPLLNNIGERINDVKLDGSFVLYEKDNEEYIDYDRQEDKWTIDLRKIIENFTKPLEDNISDLEDELDLLKDRITVLEDKVESEHPSPGQGSSLPNQSA